MKIRVVTGAVLVALMLLVLTACGSTDRPSVAEWQPTWAAVLDGIPTAAEIGEPPDRSECRGALTLVRTAEVELFPTPDPAIDGAVTEWIQVAEDAFFECPPSSTAIPDMAFAYGQLARFEAEVDAVLALDGSGG